METKIYAETEKIISERYKSIDEEIENSCSFHDIAGGLRIGLVSCVYLMNEVPEEIEKWEKEFEIHFKAIRVYFNLLKRFPEFRKGEFTSLESHFPDLYEHSYNCPPSEIKELFGTSFSPIYYVYLAQKRLEGKKD